MTQPAPSLSPDAPSSGAIVCANPACGASNRAGTRFCASCGTALAGATPSVAPGTPPLSPSVQPAAPFMPQPPRQIYGAHAAMTMDKAADVPLAPEWAYAHLTQALQSMSATVDLPNPPAGLTATIPFKSLGSPLRFRCQAAIQPTGPASSRITYGVKVDWSSTFLVLGILVGLGLFNMMFLTMWVGLLAPLLSIAGIGWAVYDYSSGIPNRLAEQLRKKLSAAPTSVSAPAPVSNPVPVNNNVTPMPKAAPSAPMPVPAPVEVQPAAAPAVDEADIITKIEKLAALKDKGLISEAEFDKRRSELLDRL